MSKSGFAEEPRRFESEEAGLRSVDYVRLKIDSAGRILIPAEMRAAMLVKPGDTVTARVEDGEFRIVSPDVALKRVQAFARKWKSEHPDAPDVVDELIAERREEARREDQRYDRLAAEGRSRTSSDSHE
jgi:AbrB family looped-hinge helix DNA binding protein